MPFDLIPDRWRFAPGAGQASRSKLSHIELILCLSAIAAGNAIFAYIYYRHRDIYSSPIVYNVTWLATNYIQFGAVRRGLVGSIIYLTGLRLDYAPFLLYGVSSLAFLLVSFFLLKRMTVRAGSMFSFLLFIVALLLFWTMDIGRTDVLVAAILTAAALALVDGHIVVASALVAVGVLVHEECAIYGLPLLAALLIDDSRYIQFKRRSLAWSAAAIATGGVAYVAIMLLPHSSNKIIVSTITSEHPALRLDNYLVQWGFYAVLGGTRAERAGMCGIYGLNHSIQLFVALIMVVVATISLSGTRPVKWILPIIASTPSIVFLWMTGTDVARWAALGILNVLIVCAVQNFVPVANQGGRFVWARVACAAAMIPIIYPRTVYVPLQYLYASPLIEKVLEIAVGRPVYKTDKDCDPTWRSVLLQDSPYRPENRVSPGPDRLTDSF